MSAASIPVDATSARNFTLNLGINGNLNNPTGAADGALLRFRIKQDIIGSRTLSFGSAYRFPAGFDSSLSKTPTVIDLVSCYYDGAEQSLFCNILKNFRDPAADPYFNSVVLLANFDSAFTDTRGKIITVTGNPTINNVIPFASGNSAKFDGLTKSSLAFGDSPDFSLDVPFTVEGFFYQEPGGEAAQAIIDFGGINGGPNGNYQSMNIYTDGSVLRYFVCSNASTFGVPVNSAGFGNLNQNAWNHYAICWDGTTYRAFLNGVLGHSVAHSLGPYIEHYGILLGAYPANYWNQSLYAILKGALGPQRITKGVSRYTENFTPVQALFPTR